KCKKAAARGSRGALMADNDNTPLSPVKGAPKMAPHRSRVTRNSSHKGRTAAEERRPDVPSSRSSAGRGVNDTHNSAIKSAVTIFINGSSRASSSAVVGYRRA
ncbi:uncharacterized protein LOC112588108, partial [Harpegnathos saltator]|uniref:uncharacterized protein LOC112588108 n=1 Tax=Harpegnathos saltator TaxID=610380 RepID=UPI000DBEEEA0